MSKLRHPVTPLSSETCTHKVRFHKNYRAIPIALSCKVKLYSNVFVRGGFMRVLCVVLFLAATLLQASAQDQSTTMSAAQSQALSQAGLDRITKEVRHELLLLPYYGVFDNLQYRVAPDGTVTLLGQVARPT